MFALRGLEVSVSVFVIVYGVTSLLVALTWRTLYARSSRGSAHRMADLLFTIRMAPFLTALAVTGGLAIPSFLLLEPRAVDEPVGFGPMLLGIGAATLLISGIIHAAIALRRADRAVALWTMESQTLDAGAGVPVRVSGPAPPMSAAGILRPRIFLSEAAQALLNTSELRIALNHELAHVRRCDNFKKLLLRVVVFPGMFGLEQAWLEASEMAADDAAVSTSSDALELAGALLKLSRLAIGRPVELTAALVHCPASALNARVQRLIEWKEAAEAPKRKYLSWRQIGAAAIVVAALSVTYSPLLVSVHTATEWLVR